MAKRIVVLLIILVMCFNSLSNTYGYATEDVKEKLLFVDNFEKYPVNETLYLDSWDSIDAKNATGGNIMVVKTTDRMNAETQALKLSSKSIYINNKPTSPDPSISKKGIIFDKESIVIQLKIKAEDNITDACIALTVKNGTSIPLLKIVSDRIGYIDRSGKIQVLDGSFELQKWYDVAVRINPASRELDFYINGIAMAKKVTVHGLDLNTDMSNAIIKIYNTNKSGIVNMTSTVYIDDIYIYRGESIKEFDSLVIEETKKFNGTIHINSNFDTAELGKKPPYWAVTLQRNIIDIKEKPGEQGRAANILLDKVGTTHMNRTFDPPIKEKVIVEFKGIALDGIGQKFVISARDKSDNFTNFIRFDANGNIALYDGTSILGYVLNKEYHIALAIDFDQKLFDVYSGGIKIIDQVQFHNRDIDHMAVIRFGFQLSSTDISAGFTSNCYIDDIRMYESDVPILYKAFPREDHVLKLRERVADTNEIQSRLSGTVALFLGINMAYVNNERKSIDPINANIKPFLADKTVMIPVRFVSEALGGNVNWSEVDQTVNIQFEKRNISVKVQKETPDFTGKEARFLEGSVFVPLTLIVDASGKKVFMDEKGLILIGSDEKILDVQKDNKLIENFTDYLVFERPAGQEIISTLKDRNEGNKHPRILATQDTFDRLKELVEYDENIKPWYEVIKRKADSMMSQPVVRYQISPSSFLLMISRAVLERVQTLGLVYKLTGNTDYADRAWREMEAAADFQDWYPAHFLGTSEMTAAFAIGYDWFYDYLSPQQKLTIRNAIHEHGLKPAIDGYRSYEWYVKATNNWAAVTNGGIAMGALAIGDEPGEELLCAEILESGLLAIENNLWEFFPEGAWKEGPSYWGYQIKYLTYYFATLQTALGTDYGYFDIPGIADTLYYPFYLSGARGEAFNFSDAQAGNPLTSEILWLAARNGDRDAAQLYINATKQFRLPPNVEAMLWYQPDNYDRDINLPKDKYYSEVEIAAFRSNWDDPNGLYAALHGGKNNESHGHLDIGTFIMEADGERWFIDLGPDSYGLPGYHQSGLTAPRWNYYRIRAEGHNTLILNPNSGLDQVLDAFSKIEKFETKPRGGFAIADTQPAFGENILSAKRGLMLTNERRAVLLQDELSSKNKINNLWWFAHTNAEISLHEEGNAALLTLNGKKMLAQILSPSNAVFTVMDAQPLDTSPNPSGQNQNRGVKKLAIRLNDLTNVRLSVAFIPLKNYETSPQFLPELKSLNEWSIPDGEEIVPVLENITIDGIDLKEFRSSKYNYQIDMEDNAYNQGIPQVSASSSEYYNVTIEQAKHIPGTVYIYVSDKQQMALTTIYRVDFTNSVGIVGMDEMKKYPVIKVTASEVPQMENTPENTIDGNFDTRWSAEGTQWIQYDLGQDEKISNVGIAWASGDMRRSIFEILFSSDGENWNVVYKGESSGETLDIEMHNVEEISARYVRIQGDGNTVNKWNSITEVMIYGKK